MNILIIEDDLIWQIKIQHMVEELGYSVVASVQQAIDASRKIVEQKPDLIISDVMLGSQTIFKTLDTEAFRSIPIIFITQSESVDHYRNSKLMMNSTYLVKPFHRITLAAAIEKLAAAKAPVVDNLGVTVKGPHNEKLYVPSSQIVFVKAELNYCVIKTPKNQFAIKRSLNSLLSELGPDLLQIHRSFAVNKKEIVKLHLNKKEIETQLGTLPIGRQFRSGVLGFLAESVTI